MTTAPISSLILIRFASTPIDAIGPFLTNLSTIELVFTLRPYHGSQALPTLKISNKVIMLIFVLRIAAVALLVAED